MKLTKVRNFVLILALVVLSFGSGYRFSFYANNALGRNPLPSFSQIIGKTAPAKLDLDFSLFWEVWDRLSRYYIDKKALNPQKMIYGAISGMVASLGDPYTVFLSPDQNKDAKDDLGGKFEGIGAQLGIKDKKIVVVAPLKGTPAEKAGIKAGDWIVKVDGKDTLNWTLPEVVSKIRGPRGSNVKLTILYKEASSTADIVVMRDTIKVASVEWELKNVQCSNETMLQCKIINEECGDCEKIVYLKLGRFGDQTSEEWVKAVAEIEKKIGETDTTKFKGIVFDLRNNPGGYLSGAVYVASEFLRDGTIVVQEHASGAKQTFSVNRSGRLLTEPIVVLINKGTASASEIVAGALAERGRSKNLVGETSFGKGSVQEAQELPGGAGIHITAAKWLLPNGKWINGTGIEPDVKVENDEKNPDTDLQLLKAVETLVK